MRTVAATLLALILLAVSGCALLDGKDRVGELIGSWSQGEHRGIQRWAPEETVVLADADDREEFLDEIPADVDRTAVEAADLTDHFLVLGSYHKCMQESRVWMDRDRTAVWFEVYVPRQKRGVVCSWSPLTVDIWRIPRSTLKSVPAQELQTAEPG